MASVHVLGLVVVVLIIAAAVAGLALVVMGLVGRARFDDPRCGKCGYDLRTFGQRPQSCPECGADLTKPGAVRFASRVRRPWMAVLGVCLLAVPLAAIAGTHVMASRAASPAPAVALSGPGLVQGMTNSQLAAAVARPEGQQPWLWEEFGRRIDAGTMSRADAVAVVDALVARLAPPPSAGGDPDSEENTGDQVQAMRSWAASAVTAICDTTLLDDAKRIELATAWVGAPEIDLPARSRRARLHLGPGSSRAVGGPFRAVERIIQIRIDGTALDEAADKARRGPMTAMLMRPLPPLEPGEHTIEVDVERLIVQQDMNSTGPSASRLQDLFENADRLPDPPGEEPRRLARSVTTLSRKVAILPAEEPMRTSFVDESKRALVQQTFRVEQAVVRRRQGKGVRVTIKLDPGTPPEGVPILVTPVLAVGDRKERGSTIGIRGQKGGYRMNGSPMLTFDLPELDPSVTSIDLVLEPELMDEFRGTAGWDRVWGEPIEIRQIRLDRRDLEGGA
ncbi:MAG: hypothetical protein U0575_05720 [Phycisphaerales bacterium]|jgi:hypothetical protein